MEKRYFRLSASCTNGAKNTGEGLLPEVKKYNSRQVIIIRQTKQKNRPGLYTGTVSKSLDSTFLY